MAEKEINQRLKAEAIADQLQMRQLETNSKVDDAPEGTLPTPIKALRGTPHEETVRIWSHQAAQGIITICDKKGCYYPLSVVRDPTKDNEPKIVLEDFEDADTGKVEKIRVGVVGLCTWAGKEHGEQVIRPQKKKED